MNAILAAVMATTISVVVTAIAMAQTQPAATLGEMKSAVEQQATQQKQGFGQGAKPGRSDHAEGIG